MALPGMPPAFTALPRRFAPFLTRLADWNDARLTRRALHRLSRHQLGDIGLDDPETLLRR